MKTPNWNPSQQEIFFFRNLTANACLQTLIFMKEPLDSYPKESQIAVKKQFSLFHYLDNICQQLPQSKMVLGLLDKARNKIPKNLILIDALTTPDLESFIELVASQTITFGQSKKVVGQDLWNSSPASIENGMEFMGTNEEVLKEMFVVLDKLEIQGQSVGINRQISHNRFWDKVEKVRRGEPIGFGS